MRCGETYSAPRTACTVLVLLMLLPKQKPPAMTYMGIRVRNDVREKLEALARREETTLTQIFRWAVQEFLERHNCDSSEN